MGRIPDLKPWEGSTAICALDEILCTCAFASTGAARERMERLEEGGAGSWCLKACPGMTLSPGPSCGSPGLLSGTGPPYNLDPTSPPRS